MPSSGAHTVMGAATIGPERAFKSAADVNALLDVLATHNVTTLDTAQLYAGSEQLLGECGAGERFTIDTKSTGGFVPGSSTEEGIVKAAEESLAKLKVKKVDVWYIHAPDHQTPLSSTLAGINTLHSRGYFARFGLSNYKVDDVRAVHAHCKEHNYVLPTVYQGNYSPVARLQESLLFPTLRELGIAFYAYSPLAGGFLTKTKTQILEGVGRFDKETPVGKIYATMYARPAFLEALEEWQTVAEKAGCKKAELAYRWVKFNSPLKEEYGDAIIVGASSLGQVEETLGWFDKGPLGEEALKGIEEVWKKIEHEAPLDNFNG